MSKSDLTERLAASLSRSRSSSSTAGTDSARLEPASTAPSVSFSFASGPVALFMAEGTSWGMRGVLSQWLGSEVHPRNRAVMASPLVRLVSTSTAIVLGREALLPCRSPSCADVRLTSSGVSDMVHA